MELPLSVDAAQALLAEKLEPVLRAQESKMAACHYAKENPQVPAWYLERRALLACRDALAQAWCRPGGGRRCVR